MVRPAIRRLIPAFATPTVTAGVLSIGIIVAIALIASSNAHRVDVGRFYRTHILPPLTATCDTPAPAWVDQIGIWARTHNIPGVQVHLRIEGQAFSCSFGEALGADGRRRPMQNTSLLLYASLTKVLTSALVLHSLDESRGIYELLELDRIPLQQPDRWGLITIDMLLKHRAGFDRRVSGDPMMQPITPCPADLASLRTVTLDFEPDTRFAYSNLGYCLLGLALERSSARPLDMLLREHLLRPLHLDSIRLTSPHDLEASDTALYFANAGEEASYSSLNWPALAASGGLAGTAQDFGRFLHALSPGSRFESVGRAMMAPLSECDDSRWRSCHGAAFYSYRQPGSRRMYWRDGSLPGSTSFAAVMENGDAFVLLANGRDPSAWMAINDDLGKLIYDHLAAPPDTGATRSERESHGGSDRFPYCDALRVEQGAAE